MSFQISSEEKSSHLSLVNVKDMSQQAPSGLMIYNYAATKGAYALKYFVTFGALQNFIRGTSWGCLILKQFVGTIPLYTAHLHPICLPVTDFYIFPFIFFIVVDIVQVFRETWDDTLG